MIYVSHYTSTPVGSSLDLTLRSWLYTQHNKEDAWHTQYTHLQECFTKNCLRFCLKNSRRHQSDFAINDKSGNICAIWLCGVPHRNLISLVGRYIFGTSKKKSLVNPERAVLQNCWREEIISMSGAVRRQAEGQLRVCGPEERTLT